jgi:hypothetical protein
VNDVLGSKVDDRGAAELDQDGRGHRDEPPTGDVDGEHLAVTGDARIVDLHVHGGDRPRRDVHDPDRERVRRRERVEGAGSARDGVTRAVVVHDLHGRDRELGRGDQRVANLRGRLDIEDVEHHRYRSDTIGWRRNFLDRVTAV